MKKICTCGLGLMLLTGLAPCARAQIPAGPPAAVPVAGAPAPLPGTPLAAPAPPNNLWSFLCPTPDQKAACKAKLCAIPLVQLLNNSMAPVTALSGGLFPPCCPPVSQADLMMPPDSAQGAAARIKQDELESKARRAAVRYLGTVDCNYWPEAQKALINALRADKNECVRLEAALSLGKGCCCTKPVIMALALTVSGGTEDKNPAEDSECVKAAAQAALDHCLSCFVEIEPVPKPIKGGEGERPAIIKTSEVSKSLPPVKTAEEYYQQVRGMSRQDVIEKVRRIAVNRPIGATTVALGGKQGGHSLLDIAVQAAQPRTTVVETNQPPKEVAVAVSKGPDAADPSPPPPTVINTKVLFSTTKTTITPVPSGTSDGEAKPAATSRVSPEPMLAPIPAPAAPKDAAPMVVPTVSVVTPAPIRATEVIKPADFQPVPITPQAPAAKPAAPLPAQGTNTTGLSTKQLLWMARESAYPEERAWAVEQLPTYYQLNGQANLAVLQALVSAAIADHSVMVRLAAVHGLSRMDASIPAVKSSLDQLRRDRDPRVREAATNALNQPVAMDSAKRFQTP